MTMHVTVDAVDAETDALETAASLFRGLGDPARLAILQHLSLGEHRVVELAEHLGRAQSTVSGHSRAYAGAGSSRRGRSDGRPCTPWRDRS